MKTLDEALETIQVEADLSTVDVDIFGWFGVSDERGIYAYFGSEKEACRQQPH